MLAAVMAFTATVGVAQADNNTDGALCYQVANGIPVQVDCHYGNPIGNDLVLTTTVGSASAAAAAQIAAGTTFPTLRTTDRCFFLVGNDFNEVDCTPSNAQSDNFWVFRNGTPFQVEFVAPAPAVVTPTPTPTATYAPQLPVSAPVPSFTG